MNISDEKKEIRSADKFIRLVEKYADFSDLTPVILTLFSFD